MITVKLAGLNFGIDNKYRHIELLARDYITDEEPLFTVSVTDEERQKEREISETDIHEGYYEAAVAYRKIAERLPEYNAFVLHGSVIEYEDKAYIITASSGVGKTTHTRLWLSEFSGKADIVNGDKPIIRMIDGVPYAFGTPWQGKENYGKNVSRPVAAIAFLERAEKNSAEKITPSEAAMKLMSQIYLPKRSAENLKRTMIYADTLLRSVKLFLIKCNMNPEAAHVSRDALVFDKF